MNRGSLISGVAGWVLVLSLPAFSAVFAVAKPETQSYGSVWNGGHQRHRGPV